MAVGKLFINGHAFDVELIVFDKDGVLIDFSHLWGKRAEKAVSALVRSCGELAGLRTILYQILGFDPQTNQVIGGRPLAMASNGEIYDLAASVLSEHGFNRLEAVSLVREHFATVLAAPPESEEIRPVRDLPDLFAQLEQSSIRYAIVTSDDRLSTERTLEYLAVDPSAILLVCGDDSIPSKPAPDAVRYISEQTGIDPADMMVVGDTNYDMQMGVAAGVGYCVGVLGGAGNPSVLAAHADVLVETIAGLSIHNDP
jgi:phosphoglycolate phosphatase